MSSVADQPIRRSSKKWSFVPGMLCLLFAVLISEPFLLRIFGRIGPHGEVADFSTGLRSLIWVLTAIIAILGVWLLLKRPQIRGRELLFALVPLVVICLVCEVGYRLYVATLNRGLLKPSSLLGWEPGENKTISDGVTMGKNGFRIWGDTETTKPRVLIIGDSYTYAASIPDGKTYAHVIKQRRPDWEVWSFGAPAYGSLQESLKYQKHVSEIEPDLVIWQFCQNDLFNNSYELESASPWQNDHMVRPYLTDRGAKTLYPKQYQNPVFWMAKYSYILRRLDAHRDLFRAMRGWSIEYELTPAHPLYLQASKRTSDIMKEVRAVRPVPVVAIVAAGYEKWTGPAFEQICEKQKIQLAAESGRAIHDARLRGEKVIMSENDPHWSVLGHQIVAEKLLMHITQTSVLETTRTSTSE